MTSQFVNDHLMSELIDAHVRHLRAANQSEDTIRSRIRLLRALHDFLPFGLAYASTEELEAFLQSNPEWKAWTKATYGTHIRSFFAWANGRYLAGDPAAAMAVPRKPRGAPHPVTDEELATALARSPEPWRTAIMLAAYAGLRVSELVGVHREHVTQETIRIMRAKGGDPANVDTHPAIWEMVKGRPRGPLCQYVDGRAAGRPVRRDWIFRHERAHFDGIGLAAVTMHRFRHWFGTMLLEGGANIRTVQDALRHRSIVSTEGYTLARGGQRRLAIRSLPAPTQHPDEN